MKRVLARVLSGIKYLFAAYMMIAGVLTCFMSPTPSKLGFFYSTRATLVVIGVIIFLSGLTLMVGKIKKNRELTGHGLFAVYLCYLFAFFLNWYALGWWAAWSNGICAVILGALYIRWKYQILYPDKALDTDRIHPVR